MDPGPPDFQLLFEASPDILLVVLPDAPRFTMVAATRSRYAATLTGPETLGRGLFEVFPDNPGDPGADGMANLRASLGRVLATRRADTMAVQKYDIRRPDGTFEMRHWSPRNLPVLAPDGTLRFILHRVEDVTDLVRASEEGEELRGRTRAMEREVLARSRELADANRSLHEANARLSGLDAAKTAFFSNVSHEFRTPLTLMLGPVEDALADPQHPLPPAQQARLELVHDNALRLLKLVNALLDFSRIEAGRMRALFAPLDLATFTAELAGMFRSAADKAGLRLEIDTPPLPEPAWVDRDLWEKIVPNLVSNALKFTTRGGVGVWLRASVDRFILEVSDTGVGIPEAELPRIFERFHRVSGTAGRTFEGTGIGLALVRELVQLHGGEVAVRSQPGRGSTFTVMIPRGFAHLPADAVSQVPVDPRVARDARSHAVEASRWTGEAAVNPAAPAAAGGEAKPRVVVVDDNADLREYVAGLLAPAYDVTVAVDGLDALAVIGRHRPELVVSDVMMPRLDGFGLVQRLRQDPGTASLPVILLSARAGEEAAIEGLDAGSDDYLVKPFAARELLARVRKNVELARLRRSLIARLEEANRELEAFSYSVSHDLRGPLQVIGGYAALLEESSAGVLDEGGRDQLRRISEGVERMRELIEALLELSRVGRTALVRGPVDLAALAREELSRLHRTDPDRRVTGVIPDALPASGDRTLLAAVLANLLGNAWKFTARTGQAAIEVGCNGEHREYFVRDNGAGFDAAGAEGLFAPFRRFHDAREYAGTGIGLATVNRIIHRHGGRLRAESAPGRGATFYFTLPDPGPG